MILNVWTVTAFFLAGVGSVLALAMAVAGARTIAAAMARDVERASDRGHLLVLVVATLGLVRALAWPHFYGVLESYVPTLAPQGVMCAYGVTRVQPELVLALQWAKPVVLALLGAWLVLVAVDRRSDVPTFQRPLLIASVPLALLALGECALEAVWLASDQMDHEVSCCAQLADLVGGSVSRNVSPLALAGFDAPWKTLAAYFALGVLVAVEALALARAPARPPEPDAKRRELFQRIADAYAALYREGFAPISGSMVKQWIRRGDPTFTESDHGFRNFAEVVAAARGAGLFDVRRAAAGAVPPIESLVPARARPLPAALRRVAVALLALAFLAVAQWAWLDAVAPRVLALPYHHCLYEVVTRAPMMGVAALATIAGGAALALAAALSFARGATPDASATIAEIARRLERAAGLALAASLLIVVVHVV
jgi:hypothetical protein